MVVIKLFLTSVTYSLKIRGFLLSSFHQEVVQWHRVGEAYGTREGGGLYWAPLDLLRQLSLSRKCVCICQLSCWNAPVMLSVAFRFWPFSQVCRLRGKLTKDGLGSRKGGHFELFPGNQDFYRLQSPVSQVLMVCSNVQDNLDFSLEEWLYLWGDEHEEHQDERRCHCLGRLVSLVMVIELNSVEYMAVIGRLFIYIASVSLRYWVPTNRYCFPSWKNAAWSQRRNWAKAWKLPDPQLSELWGSQMGAGTPYFVRQVITEKICRKLNSFLEVNSLKTKKHNVLEVGHLKKMWGNSSLKKEGKEEIKSFL